MGRIARITAGGMLMAGAVGCAATGSGAAMPRAAESEAPRVIAPCTPGPDSLVWPPAALEPAVQLVQLGPSPALPPSREAAGEGGVVVWQFVVDAEGRIEPCSLEVLSATRVDFIEPARASLLGQRFAPGERAGRRVRALVQQRMTFRLGR